MLGGGREEVEDPAADRELPTPADHVDPGVGQLDQPGSQGVEVQFGAHRQRDGLDLGEVGGHRLQQGAHRGDDHPQRRPKPGVLRMGQPTQQHEPGADGVDPGREPLVREGLPGREQRGRVAVHAAQLRDEIVGVPTGGCDDQQRPGMG